MATLRGGGEDRLLKQRFAIEQQPVHVEHNGSRPDVEMHLARVAQVLTAEPDLEAYLMPEPLAQRLKMDLGTFNKAIEKLIAQGAAAIDLAGNVRAAGPVSSKESWRAGYDAQIAFRRSQIDRMVAFAETQQCRMTAVIRHFGDTADVHRPCGRCDFCSPSTTSAQTFAAPTPAQARDLLAILSALVHAPFRATGKLYTDLAPSLETIADRKAFDVLLDSLARAGLITLTSETFINSEGRVLPYKKASLTHEGRSQDAAELVGVVLPIPSDEPPSRSQSKRTSKSSSRKSSKTLAKPSSSRPALAKSASSSGPDPERARRAERVVEEPVLSLSNEPPHRFRSTTGSAIFSSQTFHRARPAASDPTTALTPDQQLLDTHLRAWRKAESERIGLPQFFVLGSSTLRSIVLNRPRTLAQLQAITGIGPDKAEKFGASIVELCNA